MNDTPLVLKGCMTVVALSLILQYVVYSWSKLKGRGGGGKVHCHWQGSISQVKVIVGSGGTLLLRAIVVMIPLLLVIAGDVETNPGPEGNFFGCGADVTQWIGLSKLNCIIVVCRRLTWYSFLCIRRAKSDSTAWSML